VVDAARVRVPRCYKYDCTMLTRPFPLMQLRVQGNRTINVAAGAGELAAVQLHLLVSPDLVFSWDPR